MELLSRIEFNFLPTIDSFLSQLIAKIGRKCIRQKTLGFKDYHHFLTYFPNVSRLLEAKHVFFLMCFYRCWKSKILGMFH